MKSRRVEILAAAVVLFLCTSPVLATIHFKDGGIHDIDYQVSDGVWVDYESPGLETTLNILDGATIPSRYDVRAWEDSIINILGGLLDDIIAYDSSQVTVSGGSINNHLWAYDNSQVTVSGGEIGRDLYAYGSSQVTVSGGSINSHLWAYDNSQVTVSGGLFGGELLVRDTAVLTIHGWDFAVDGTPVGYTELSSIFGSDLRFEPHRQLTGTLLSGDPINNQFRIGYNGKIFLVPEPASAVILGLGGFFLVLRRRRRQA